MCAGGENLEIIPKIWILESVGDEKPMVARPHKKRFGNRIKYCSNSLYTVKTNVLW